MNDLVCLERVGAWLRAKLAEPGILRGRQRGEEYVERLIRFGLYVARAHGRDDHEHIFPLSRMPMSGLASLGLPEWSIRSFVGVLTRIGFVEPQGALIRRCHAGTVSPTEGAKAVWWSPRQFKLSQAIRSLFGKSPDPALDAAPLGNQSTQNETLNLSGEEQTQTTNPINGGLEVLGGLEADDDDIDDELEEALDDYRRTVVPAAMPDRRRAQRWEPTEADKLAMWEAAGGALVLKPLKLSAEALRPRAPGLYR